MDPVLNMAEFVPAENDGDPSQAPNITAVPAALLSSKTIHSLLDNPALQSCNLAVAKQYLREALGDSSLLTTMPLQGTDRAKGNIPKAAKAH